LPGRSHPCCDAVSRSRSRASVPSVPCPGVRLCISWRGGLVGRCTTACHQSTLDEWVSTSALQHQARRALRVWVCAYQCSTATTSPYRTWSTQFGCSLWPRGNGSSTSSPPLPGVWSTSPVLSSWDGTCRCRCPVLSRCTWSWVSRSPARRGLVCSHILWIADLSFLGSSQSLIILYTINILYLSMLNLTVNTRSWPSQTLLFVYS
jgi:hypothetical protein